MPEIRIAIAGVGNCASSLVQGISYYAARRADGLDPIGLRHPDLGGYRVEDILPVAAFDIDSRKVGRPLNEAIFALPNNTKKFAEPGMANAQKPTGANGDANGNGHDLGSRSEATARSGAAARSGAGGQSHSAGLSEAAAARIGSAESLAHREVIVQMSPILDGISPHMADYPPHQRFEPSQESPVDVVRALRDSGAEILLNYLPVGSQQATEFFAEACLQAGVSLVNCIPVFIVSHLKWAGRFTAAGIPCVGDDVKAQVGATITHRTLVRLFQERGVRVDSTYQINTGGNTDFLNMLSRDRLASKKISKTDAVQSQMDVPIEKDHIHIGPSDFVPFLKDNKVCFMRLEGTGFGGVPMNIEARLSVEDSPNSAGVVVDAIRCCKLARDAGLAGPIEAASAWTMKHPPRQMVDADALAGMEEFVARSGRSEGRSIKH